MPRLTQQVDVVANTSRYESALKQLSAKTRAAVNGAGTSGGGGFGTNGFLSGAAGRMGLGGLAGGGGAALAGGAAIGAITAVTVAFGALVKSSMDLADKIGDLADQTGYTTDDIQALRISARKGDKTEEDAINMLREAKNNRIEALEGNEGKLAAFAQFGFSEEDLKDKDFFKNNIGKFNSNSDQNRKALGEIFGKKNVGTFNVMRDDLMNLDKVKEDNKHRIMSPEDIDAVDEFKNSLEELWDTLKVAVAKDMTPILYDLSEAFVWAAEHVEKAWDIMKLLGVGGLLTSAGSINRGAAILRGDDPDKKAETASDPNSRISQLRADRAKRLEEQRLNRKSIFDVGEENIVNKKRADEEAKAKEKALKDLKEELKMQQELMGVLQKPDSDQLLSVGNFLGSNGNNLESIASQQLDVAREMAGYLRRIAERPNNVGVVG